MANPDLNRQTREFIQREVTGRKESRTGTVLTRPVLKFFGTGVAETWVVDVSIGSNRELKNIPIKMGPGGSRSYADQGTTVKLLRNLDQKWQIVGPGDRSIGITEINIFDPGSINPIGSPTMLGQSFVVRPFIHFQGDLITGPTPGSGLWGTKGFPRVEKVDGDGNVIP